MDQAELLSQLPEPLQARLTRLEARVKDNGEKIAVFDLDNTLLEGDIGDALFVTLKAMEKEKPLRLDGGNIPLTWQDYMGLIENEGKRTAYTRVITAMAGIPKSLITDVTCQIMKNPARSVDSGAGLIPVPKPDPMMKALVKCLQTMNFRIFVISASNQFSVSHVAEKYFGINPTNTIGIVPSLIHTSSGQDIIGDKIEGIPTVDEGKALAYHQSIGMMPPLITAGDSSTDLPILKLTDPKGLCIWVGDNSREYEFIKNSLTNPNTGWFCHRPRFKL